MNGMLRLAAALGLALPAMAASAGRPPIVGLAAFSIKTDDLPAERTFFGTVLGLPQTSDQGRSVTFQVNGRQSIEVSPDLQDASQDRLSFIAFETKDVRALRAYLESRGVEVAAAKTGIRVKDPDGHTVEFVQFAPGASKEHFSERQLSTHIAHVGVAVHDRGAADRFYSDVLGFRLLWEGGPSETQIVYVCMRVPEGRDWIEYMLGDQPGPPKTLAAKNHCSLEVPSVEAGARAVEERGYHPPRPPNIGRNGRWQVNLYDPDLTRVELMEPKPVRPPCCSKWVDP